MTKIKISDEKFKELYEKHKIADLMRMFGTSATPIYSKAKKLGLSAYVPFVSMKKNPNVIPGGLLERGS